MDSSSLSRFPEHSAHSPVSHNPKTIKDLPDEVMVKVWENLSAKEVRRLRRVCKRFYGIYSRHGEHLAKKIVNRESARLQRFVDENVEYTDNPAFLEKLGRWVRHRGLWSQDRNGSGCFAFHYLRSKGGLFSEDTLGVWQDLAEAIIHIFSEHANGYQPESREEFVRDTVRWQASHGIGEVEAGQWWDQITSEQCPLTGARDYPEGDEWISSVPANVVTPICMDFSIYWATYEPLLALIEAGSLPMPEFVGLFPSAPPLPPWLMFAYYLPDKRMMRSLRKYRATREKGRRSPMREAAIMEELRIF